jgi:hypothetical protein
MSRRPPIANRLRVAHASRVLVSASRRNNLSICAVFSANNALRNVCDREDACATREERPFPGLSPCSRGEDEGEGSERTRFGAILTRPLSPQKGEATQTELSRRKISPLG